MHKDDLIDFLLGGPFPAMVTMVAFGASSIGLIEPDTAIWISIFAFTPYVLGLVGVWLMTLFMVYIVYIPSWFSKRWAKKTGMSD